MGYKSFKLAYKAGVESSLVTGPHPVQAIMDSISTRAGHPGSFGAPVVEPRPLQADALTGVGTGP